MGTQPIHQRIKDIADHLVAERQTMSRSDLAFELKEFGINGDSLDIAQTIYAAYTAFQNNRNIRLAFVDAVTNNSVVEDAVIFDKLEQGTDQVQQLMQSALTRVDAEQQQLSTKVMTMLSGQVAKAAATIGQHLSGTSGIVKVQQEASSLYKGYGEMIFNYEGYKTNIGALIQQFIYLRDKVADSYRRHAIELIDVFGEDIKSVDPQLFNFEQIQWLDTQGMQKKVSLEFGKLQQICAGLLSSISDQFQTAISSSAQTYKAVNHRGIGLAILGLSLFSHYAQANAQTNELRIELERFKHLIHADATTIRTDMLRLLGIYKSLNDVAVPRAIAFLRMADKVLDNDYQSLLSELYSNDEVRALQEERNEALQEMRQLEDKLADHRANIENYQVVLQDNRQELANRNVRYQVALREKPSKSPLLLNVLFLGILNAGYDKKIYDWKQQYGTIEQEYEDLQIDIRLFEEDLDFHTQHLQEGQQKLKHLKVQLESINRRIREALSVAPDVKQKVAQKLKDIVALLRLAREIASSKVDQRLLHATVTHNVQDLQLPPEVLKGLSSFTFALREASLPKMQEEVLSNYTEADDKGNQPTDEEKEKLKAQVASTAEHINQLVDSVARLKLIQEQGEADRIVYEQKYAALQQEFKKVIAESDNRSALLRDALQKMNTAHSPREVKEALFLLSDGEIEVSMKEVNDFLTGKGQLTL